MQSSVSSRDRIVRALADRGGWASLQGLAEDIDLDASTTHRHLAHLLRAGAVVKEGGGKETTYGLKPRIEVSWTGTSSRETASDSDHWLHWQWTGQGPVDWRFPLVSRIPQVDGQRTMQRFLEHCWQRGLLGPLGIMQAPPGEKTSSEPSRRMMERIGQDMDRLRDGLTFIVFGSYARGDARRDSDLDVLVITPPDWALDNGAKRPADRLQDLVDEFNLGSLVPVDLVTRQREHPEEEFPKGLWFAICTEGLTVHTTNLGEYIEDFGGRRLRYADDER